MDDQFLDFAETITKEHDIIPSTLKLYAHNDMSI